MITSVSFVTLEHSKDEYTFLKVTSIDIYLVLNVNSFSMAPLLFSSLRKNLMNRKINTFLCLYNRITRKKAHLSPYSFSFVLSFLIVNFAARSKVVFLSYIRGGKLEPHLSCH